MPKARIDGHSVPKKFLMQLPEEHRRLLDEIATESPESNRSAIIRAALEEYAERHYGRAVGAA